MLKPNYKNGSIVNLTSSLIRGMGGKSRYGPLKSLKPVELHEYDNVVLLLIDGLGNEFLEKYGKKTFLLKNRKSVITSVFPATTASAVTTFLTGLAPNRHAITGWHMFFKEMDKVITPLLSVPRGKKSATSSFRKKYSKIINQPTIFEKIKRRSIYIFPKKYLPRIYTAEYRSGAKSATYENVNGFFRLIERTAKEKKDKKYVFAYWPKLDSFSHKFGTKHKRTKRHFLLINNRIQTLSEKIKSTNSIILVTADHGLNDATKSRIIQAENHPKFQDCLALPLCGEKKAAYCYVKLNKTLEFEHYVGTKLKKYCDLYKSKDILSQKFFGPGKNNPKIKSRIGDYILVMKNGFAIRDRVGSEEKKLDIGNHGAMSKEELFVPLIVIK